MSHKLQEKCEYHSRTSHLLLGNGLVCFQMYVGYLYHVSGSMALLLALCGNEAWFEELSTSAKLTEGGV